MKKILNPLPGSQAALLKAKLKEVHDPDDQNYMIRLHRAISWIKCAEEQTDNPDLKFITLWIAFNACYAKDDDYDHSLTEKECFREFISKLVSYDHEEHFFNLLWHKFSGPVGLLIENQFAYKQFWDAQHDKSIDWQKLFEKSINKSRNYLSQHDIAGLLEVVLDRLYTVRNQLLHGGATYKSKLNRSQVKDAGEILGFLMPVIIDIMITNIDDDWGVINYPVIE